MWIYRVAQTSPHRYSVLVNSCYNCRWNFYKGLGMNSCKNSQIHPKPYNGVVHTVRPDLYYCNIHERRNDAPT